MCPPKVAQQLTSPPSIEGALSNITASTAHSGPGALMSWRRHHPLPPPMGGEQGAQRSFTRRGRDLGGVGSLPERVPTRIRYGMEQRASVAFLRALLSFCEKRVAGDRERRREPSGTHRCLPIVTSSLVPRSPWWRGLPVVAPAEARPLEGRGAPGWRMPWRPTARLSQDFNTNRTNVTESGGRLR